MRPLLVERLSDFGLRRHAYIREQGERSRLRSLTDLQSGVKKKESPNITIISVSPPAADKTMESSADGGNNNNSRLAAASSSDKPPAVQTHPSSCNQQTGESNP